MKTIMTLKLSIQSNSLSWQKKKTSEEEYCVRVKYARDAVSSPADHLGY